MIKVTKVIICETQIGKKPDPLKSTACGIILNCDRYWFDKDLSFENLFHSAVFSSVCFCQRNAKLIKM